MDILQGVPVVPSTGKRVRTVYDIGNVDIDDVSTDAREAIDAQRDELMRVLVDSMLRDAVSRQGIEHVLPFAPGKNAMLVLTSPEGWLNAVSEQCFPLTGCRLVRGLGRAPKELDAAVAGALAGGRNCGVVIASLDELPGWVHETADAVLHLAAPAAHDLLHALEHVGAGDTIQESDLAGVDLSEVGGGFVRAAWRTPDPRLNAKRMLRALRAKSKPTAARAPGFESLHGMPVAQSWGRRLARDLAAYRAGKLAWGDLDCGLLISGAPGTGKTRFAGALAVECGVPLVQGSMAAWQGSGEGHLGSMLKAMSRTFEQARASAPCILFIDELDSVGDRRTMQTHRDYSAQVVNALLEHLDGTTRRDGVVIVGATNFPEHVDSALRRAGRLDRHLLLTLPDADARAAILAQYAGVSVQDAQEPAQAMVHCSGADLEAVARDARRLARDAGVPVRAGHLRLAWSARWAEWVNAAVDLGSLPCGTMH